MLKLLMFSDFLGFSGFSTSGNVERSICHPMKLSTEEGPLLLLQQKSRMPFIIAGLAYFRYTTYIICSVDYLIVHLNLLLNRLTSILNSISASTVVTLTGKDFDFVPAFFLSDLKAMLMITQSLLLIKLYCTSNNLRCIDVVHDLLESKSVTNI